MLDQRTGRHEEQAQKFVYSMAATPTEQPEMAELASNPLRDGAAPVAAAARPQSATSFIQPEAEASSSGQDGIEQPTSSQEVETSTTTPGATTASMYPVTSARSNGDGTVRGANNSTDSVPKLGDANTDMAAAEPQSHPAASASSTTVPTFVQPKQDGIITTMTSSTPTERESQEKGDQVTLELVGANEAVCTHVDNILTPTMILCSCCFPDHGEGSPSRPPQRLTKCWLGHSKIGHQVRYTCGSEVVDFANSSTNGMQNGKSRSLET